MTGEGLDAVRAALLALRDRGARLPDRPPTLAIDRVFSVKGRGVVVTGHAARRSARGRGQPAGGAGGAAGADGTVRIREIQVHGASVSTAWPAAAGRRSTWPGPVSSDLRRGVVLTADPSVVATDRVLAVFSVAGRGSCRGHASMPGPRRSMPRSAARTRRPHAAGRPDGRDPPARGTGRRSRPGDRFVLRRGTAAAPVGGVVLDTVPPRGLSRRRQTPERVAALATGARRAPSAAAAAARLELHGALVDGHG